MLVWKTVFLVWLMAFSGLASAEVEGLLTREQLHKLHAKMDADANGKLSLDEVTQFSHETRKSTAAKDGKEMMESMDDNQDGKISLDEIRKIHGDVDEGHDVRNLAALKASNAREEEKFLVADGNSDGLLDETELAAFFYPELHGDVLRTVAQHSMEDKDLDKDGFLTAAEFWEKKWRADSISEVPEGEPSVHPSNDWELQTFKKLDKDGSGKIDVKELLVWEAGYLHTEEAMENFMQLADTDSDQHVTVEELHAAHEKGDNEAKFHLMDMAHRHEL